MARARWSIGALGVLALALAGGTDAARGQAAVITTDPALRVFTARVNEYAALHQRLEKPLPPLDPAGGLRSYRLNQAYLAAAIKTARPHARQGDLFTPEAAVVFRRIVAETLRGRDVEAFLEDHLETDCGRRAYHPAVYEAYPSWAPHGMPVSLLTRLPPLPADIEYRVVDHDLVILDIHADLILDVLVDAFAAHGRAEGEATGR